jgi:uncharacterized protein (TIGR00369 family)
VTTEPPPTEGRADLRISGRLIEIEPHNCFACGSLNAHGLQLVLHADDDHCWTELTLALRFEGWAGIAHGGILCTILDEVMAWALINHDTWGVTARMTVDFKRPVPVGIPIRAEGRVIEAHRRLYRTEALILDPASETVLATAQGVYVAAPEERKRELKARYGFRYVEQPGPGAGETPGGVDARSPSPWATEPAAGAGDR